LKKLPEICFGKNDREHDAGNEQKAEGGLFAKISALTSEKARQASFYFDKKFSSFTDLSPT
jgi:hypothetical protein